MFSVLHRSQTCINILSALSALLLKPCSTESGLYFLKLIVVLILLKALLLALLMIVVSPHGESRYVNLLSHHGNSLCPFMEGVSRFLSLRVLEMGAITWQLTHFHLQCMWH